MNVINHNQLVAENGTNIPFLFHILSFTTTPLVLLLNHFNNTINLLHSTTYIQRNLVT